MFDEFIDLSDIFLFIHRFKLNAFNTRLKHSCDVTMKLETAGESGEEY